MSENLDEQNEWIVPENSYVDKLVVQRADNDDLDMDYVDKSIHTEERMDILMVRTNMVLIL